MACSSRSGPSTMVFSASKSRKTRSSAAAPCWTVAKLPPEPAGGAGDDAEAGQEAGEVGDGDGAGRMRRPTTKRSTRDGDADQHLHHRRDPGLPAVLADAQAEEPLEDAARRSRPAAPRGGRCGPCGCRTRPSVTSEVIEATSAWVAWRGGAGGARCGSPGRARGRRSAQMPIVSASRSTSITRR